MELGAIRTAAPDIETQTQNLVLAATSVLSNAGSDQSVNVIGSVTLDGSASSGPAGVALTYAWSFVSRPAGSAATLAGANSATPSFDPDEPGEYVL